MIFTFRITVVEVFEKKSKRHVSGAGDSTKFEEYSLGWFVSFDDFTSRYFGKERPDISVGDKITLKFERSQ